MDDECIVNVFLRRCLADLEQGKLGTHHEYQALFPGHEELIAAEYERLHLAAAAAGVWPAQRLQGLLPRVGAAHDTEAPADGPGHHDGR